MLSHKGGDQMLRNNIIRKGILIGATALVLAASIQSINDASLCAPCTFTSKIYGTVRRTDGNPPDPNVITVHYQCDNPPNCSSSNNIDCLITNSIGYHEAWIGPSCPTNPDDGNWRVWASGLDNGCERASDTVVVFWDGSGNVEANVTLIHTGNCY